ncbi:MAG TPA: Gfo/Idh/MocA family oxidoreductase [Chloroflexota bacterium]|nr:Gfo/Idh/MocA family oxidoreductase [Chloroflexota bacterium]
MTSSTIAPNTPHRVAVIGLRSVGGAHVRAWAAYQRANPHIRLVAVCDLDAELCRRAAGEYGVPETYGSVDDLLARSDADLITICLPTGLHERMAAACFEQGRHVLCEKPPALDPDSAQRMAEAAAAASRVLAYGFQRRFHPQVRAALEVAKSGCTGPLFYGRCGWVRSEPNVGATVPWKLGASTGGGGLLNIGIHLLDVAWYLMGRPRPLTASAFGSTHGTRLVASAASLPLPADPAHDTTAALVRFEHDDGTPAALLVESSLALHRLSPQGAATGSLATGSQSVYCDLSGTEGGLSVYPPAFVSGRTVEPLAVEDDAREQTTRRLLIEDFLRAVDTGTPPRATAEDGVAIMRIVDTIERSAGERRELSI